MELAHSVSFYQKYRRRPHFISAAPTSPRLNPGVQGLSEF